MSQERQTEILYTLNKTVVGSFPLLLNFCCLLITQPLVHQLDHIRWATGVLSMKVNVLRKAGFHTTQIPCTWTGTKTHEPPASASSVCQIIHDSSSEISSLALHGNLTSHTARVKYNIQQYFGRFQESLQHNYVSVEDIYI